MVRELLQLISGDDVEVNNRGCSQQQRVRSYQLVPEFRRDVVFLSSVQQNTRRDQIPQLLHEQQMQMLPVFLPMCVQSLIRVHLHHVQL